MQQNNGAAAQNAQLPFYIQKDGHGTEHKIIDLNNKDICPRDGIIIIEATTRKNASRANDIPFKMCKDKLSGVLIGICTGIDSQKNLMWLPIALGKSTMFNLEIDDEAKKAACILRSNIVEGSPNLSSNINLAFFRVHDQLKEATLNIKRIKDGQRAIEIASGLTGESLENMGRNLGIAVAHANHAIILSQVLSRAEKNPSEFLRIYENPNRDQVTIFHRGVETGIITHDPITGYFFRGVPLGVNEAFVVDYFNKYKDVCASVDMMSKERMKATNQSALNQNAPQTPSVDPEKEALKKQLAEMREQLDKKNAPINSDLQTELDALKITAEGLGVLPLHVYKPTKESIDKLKLKIAQKVPA